MSNDRAALLRLLLAAAFPELHETPTAQARSATDADADLIRERDEARATAADAVKDAAVAHEAATALKSACEGAERSAKAAREARDASEAKLRDAQRAAEQRGQQLNAVMSERDEWKRSSEARHEIYVKAAAERDEQTAALAALRKAYSEHVDSMAPVRRDLDKTKQALDAANHEINRLRPVGRTAP